MSRSTPRQIRVSAAVTLGLLAASAWATGADFTQPSGGQSFHPGETITVSWSLDALAPEDDEMELVLSLAAKYPVRLICRATGWSRSSVYHDDAPAPDEGRLRRALGRLAAR